MIAKLCSLSYSFIFSVDNFASKSGKSRVGKKNVGIGVEASFFESIIISLVCKIMDLLFTVVESELLQFYWRLWITFLTNIIKDPMRLQNSTKAIVIFHSNIYI